MKHFAPPVAVDLLAQAVERVRDDLDRAIPLKQRARNFWAGIRCSNRRGAADVVEKEFTQVAQETGLLGDLGEQTVAHLIAWGLRALDPFGDVA